MHIRKPLPEELPGIGQLVFAAIAAVLISVLLIVTVVLPAERGTDPVSYTHLTLPTIPLV